MKLAKDQIVKVIKDAGKIPVERDAFYNPLNVYSENVIGKIPYLNSVPFFHNFDKDTFKPLPVAPRRMGILNKQGQLDAGLFSLMIYFEQEENLELLPWCIAARDQVKSVMLFSKHNWRELDGKTIGIIDDTATSVQLLRVLLEKKYEVKGIFKRLQPGSDDYAGFDAVLLIGDEALRQNKFGLPDFKFVYDLATEWFAWKQLPFVFAVWAVKKSLPDNRKNELKNIIEKSLQQSNGRFGEIGELHGKRIGLDVDEIAIYLKVFNYRLGEKEKEAMIQFRLLVSSDVR